MDYSKLCAQCGLTAEPETIEKLKKVRAKISSAGTDVSEFARACAELFVLFVELKGGHAEGPWLRSAFLKFIQMWGETEPSTASKVFPPGVWSYPLLETQALNLAIEDGSLKPPKIAARSMKHTYSPLPFPEAGYDSSEMERWRKNDKTRREEFKAEIIEQVELYRVGDAPKTETVREESKALPKEQTQSTAGVPKLSEQIRPGAICNVIKDIERGMKVTTRHFERNYERKLTNMKSDVRRWKDKELAAEVLRLLKKIKAS